MDALEDRMIQLRAERKLLREQLETADDATRAAHNRRLTEISAELKAIAVELDLPGSR